eukprot:TRINITY_DN12642_c0_g1_i1.p1 TRINITY_DN12642_c0_g1~~TRINITY_DN12642_c0_g1_i1.p1  ORF type:complete len:212 (-),score=55.06 TRINITY_DN12642_c0_g1_i1:164-799(-)
MKSARLPLSNSQPASAAPSVVAPSSNSRPTSSAPSRKYLLTESSSSHTSPRTRGRFHKGSAASSTASSPRDSVEGAMGRLTSSSSAKSEIVEEESEISPRIPAGRRTPSPRPTLPLLPIAALSSSLLHSPFSSEAPLPQVTGSKKLSSAVTVLEKALKTLIEREKVMKVKIEEMQREHSEYAKSISVVSSQLSQLKVPLILPNILLFLFTS